MDEEKRKKKRERSDWLEGEIRDLKKKVGGWEKEEENCWHRKKIAQFDRERKEQFQREV